MQCVTDGRVTVGVCTGRAGGLGQKINKNQNSARKIEGDLGYKGMKIIRSDRG